MKSTIDWNEIFPLLKKPLRDTLLLEAVEILSRQPRPEAEPPRRGNRTPGGTAGGDGIRALGLRSWRIDGPGGTLAAEGQWYRINRKVEGPRRGKIGRVWKLLKESQNDTISYSGLLSIIKGQEGQGSSVVAQLWENRCIDVVVKPVAVAYVGPQGK